MPEVTLRPYGQYECTKDHPSKLATRHPDFKMGTDSDGLPMYECPHCHLYWRDIPANDPLRMGLD